MLPEKSSDIFLCVCVFLCIRYYYFNYYIFWETSPEFGLAPDFSKIAFKIFFVYIYK